MLLANRLLVRELVEEEFWCQYSCNVARENHREPINKNTVNSTTTGYPYNRDGSSFLPYVSCKMLECNKCLLLPSCNGCNDARNGYVSNWLKTGFLTQFDHVAFRNF